MSEIKFEIKNESLNYSGKENSMINSSKENFSINKGRNTKTTTKLLFSVFKNPNKVETKEDKKETKLEEIKEKVNNNLINKLNVEETDKNNNNIKKKEQNDIIKSEENFKNGQKIVFNNIQKEKIDENKNNVNNKEKDIINKNNIINNNSPPPIINSNLLNISNTNIEKNNSPPPIIDSNSANINIINSNNPAPMINNNSINTNIINNTINNSIINNNYNIRYNDLNNNNSNNINNNNINNNMNLGLNSNCQKDLIFKENNINKNINIEKNNIINNQNFKRGQSIPNKLNRNLLFNNTPHLLENAIINNQFEPPKRKVILKDEKYPSPSYIGNNNPYNSKNYQKIINLDESDSENFFYSNNHEEDKISQYFDDDDFKDDDEDEDYHINNSESKLSKRKKIKINPFPRKKEIDNALYVELNDLIKKNTFIKIVDYMSKYYKNELKTNPDQKEDKEIFEKINDILSKNNRNSINLTLIYILSNNYRESQLKLMDLINLPNKKEESLEIKEKTQRRGKSQKLISNTDLLTKKRKHTKKPSPPFYYGKHFFKIHDRIYTYVPKAKTSSLNRYTLYCMYRAKDECKAKMIVHQNDNKISYIGRHICTPKLTIEDFYKKFPYIQKEPDWSHIQFAVENEKPFILSRF